jgi:hypothetical protein
MDPEIHAVHTVRGSRSLRGTLLVVLVTTLSPAAFANTQLAPAAPSAPAAAAPKPFNLVYIGDSIMTGQALATPQKFMFLVRDWLQSKMPNRPVALYSAAHSGAQILAGSPAEEAMPSQLYDATGTHRGLPVPTAWAKPKSDRPPFAFETGYDMRAEVPIHFSSITHQAKVLVPKMMAGQQVDLLVITGGINDVDVAKILTIEPPGAGEALADLSTLWNDLTGSKPFPPAGQLLARTQWVADLTHTNATLRMQGLLNMILHDPVYAKAQIVFLGYFPIVSARTPPTQIADVLKTFVSLPIPSIAIEVLTAKFSAQSSAFAHTINKEYRELAKASPRLVFAPLHWDDTFSYGARKTMLGRFQDTNDPLFHSRGGVCGANQHIYANQGTMGPYANTATSLQPCFHAQTGHPNRNGSRLYAHAIEVALGARLCSMLSLPKLTVDVSTNTIALHPAPCATGGGMCPNPAVSAVTLTAKDATGKVVRSTTLPVLVKGSTKIVNSTDAHGKKIHKTSFQWSIAPIHLDVPGYCPAQVKLTLANAAGASSTTVGAR